MFIVKIACNCEDQAEEVPRFKIPWLAIWQFGTEKGPGPAVNFNSDNGIQKAIVVKSVCVLMPEGVELIIFIFIFLLGQPRPKQQIIKGKSQRRLEQVTKPSYKSTFGMQSSTGRGCDAS